MYTTKSDKISLKTKISLEKAVFRSADIIPDDRIVFTIKGNSYWIIVKVRYATQTMFIRFIGTHAEYDKVNAETI